MHKSARRFGRSAAVSGAVAVAAVLMAGTAHAAIPSPEPIGPNEAFNGLVNGTSDSPVVTTDCVGPVLPGEMGHPVDGQFVSVVPAAPGGSAADLGFTGDVGDSVAVFLGPEANSGSSLSGLVGTLTNYTVELAISTKLEVPCDGPGAASFVPEPTSATARTAVLGVTFRSIGVAPGA
jgi:hypothetical protein